MYSKEVITGGATQYHYQDETGKNIVGKKISLADLKAIPAGYGGRIGVIPWCIVENTKYHILCDIHWEKRGKKGNVMGDLGGGIKRYQTPYAALYTELRDEVPEWFDILQAQLENSPIDIHSIEYLHSPYYKVRYSITIFVDITPHIKVLNELFNASKEIHGLHAFNDFDDMLLLNTNMNYGLTYFKDYIVYQHLCNEREKQKREEEQKQRQEEVIREIALQHQIALQKQFATQHMMIHHMQQQQQQIWMQHQMWMRHQMQMQMWMKSQNINMV
jgi:hypothetical protein